MGPARQLAYETWSEYFEAVNRELLDAHVSIEVAGSGRPLVRDCERLSLRALTYDRRQDILEVALAGEEVGVRGVVRHLVLHPERVAIDTPTMLAPMTISVEGRDGLRTLFRFERDPDAADFS